MAVPRSPLNNAKLLVTIAARSATNSDQAMSRSYPWPSPSLAQWPDPFTGTRGLVAFRARRRPARGAGAAVGRRPGRAGRDLLLPRRASPKAPRRLAWGTFWPGALGFDPLRRQMPAPRPDRRRPASRRELYRRSLWRRIPAAIHSTTAARVRIVSISASRKSDIFDRS